MGKGSRIRAQREAARGAVGAEPVTWEQIQALLPPGDGSPGAPAGAETL